MSELIRIAARLLSPEISDNPDDYNKNIPQWLIRKIGSHRDKLRDYAISIRAEHDHYSKLEKELTDVKEGKQAAFNRALQLEQELKKAKGSLAEMVEYADYCMRHWDEGSDRFHIVVIQITKAKELLK